MARGTCFLAISDVCVWLAIVTSIAALFAPFWQSESTVPIKSRGLFMSCTDPYDDHTGDTSCTFSKIDIKNDPKWLVSVQGLWAGGTALLCLIGVIGFFLCCESCRRASCTSLVFVLTLIAALALSAAVILYGVFNDKDNNTSFNRNEVLYFDWGYYLAIASAGLSLIAALLFAFVICCVRKE